MDPSGHVREIAGAAGDREIERLGVQWDLAGSGQLPSAVDLDRRGADRDRTEALGAVDPVHAELALLVLAPQAVLDHDECPTTLSGPTEIDGLEFSGLRDNGYGL